MRLAGALVVLVLAAGCGEDVAQQPSQTTAGAAPCGEQGLQEVAFDTAEGTEVGGVLAGDGEVGVVLGHQFRSNYCSWAPFAKELAEQGMRALAINFSSTPLDQDMVAAANELRRRGSKRIVLVGASMGGTAALVAAPKTDVVGVASLSGPRQFEGMDALPAVRQIEAPVLFLAGKQDTDFARDARTLYGEAAAPDKKLVVTSGYEHGTDLLQDPKAKRALLDFLSGLEGSG